MQKLHIQIRRRGSLEFQREVHRCRCPRYLSFFSFACFYSYCLRLQEDVFSPRPTWSSFATTFSICDIAGGANTPSFVCSVVVCGGGSDCVKISCIWSITLRSFSIASSTSLSSFRSPQTDAKNRLLNFLSQRRWHGQRMKPKFVVRFR